MAESPAHKFGQILGDVLEDTVEPLLNKFARREIPLNDPALAAAWALQTQKLLATTGGTPWQIKMGLKFQRVPSHFVALFRAPQRLRRSRRRQQRVPDRHQTVKGKSFRIKHFSGNSADHIPIAGILKARVHTGIPIIGGISVAVCRVTCKAA